MTDIRTRLADALIYEVGADVEDAYVAADALLSLPGIAIVNLPESPELSTRWSTFCRLSPDKATLFAAALIASANEQGADR